MGIFEAALFGLLQGVTEFIPVSSAAHLCVLFNLFGITASGFNVKAFSVFLHFGTIIAAFITYWQDFGEVLFQSLEFAASGSGGAGGPKRKSFPAARLMIMMLFSILPLVMILPLSGYINRLFEMNGLVGIMLVLTGLILFVSDRLWGRDKTERNMSLSDAILIGLAQSVSAIPGISRTGIVYTAGVAVGLQRDFAAKYTWMLRGGAFRSPISRPVWSAWRRRSAQASSRSAFFVRWRRRANSARWGITVASRVCSP